MKSSSRYAKHACAYWKHWANGWEALGISTDEKKQLHWELSWQHGMLPEVGATGAPWRGGQSPTWSSTVECAEHRGLCLPRCSLPPLALPSRMIHLP